MRFPNLADKHKDAPVFTAADLLAHRRRKGAAPDFAPPQAVIFCYQPALLQFAVKKWRGKQQSGFFGAFYLLKKTNGRVGVMGNFGVGAPVTAVLLEELAAFGVPRFIIISMVGGLQETSQAGDLIVADRALRDEGVSHHYLPSARFALPSPVLTQRLRRALDSKGLSYQVGATWTTDAPYRETSREIAQYQEEGVLAVEMETAALFAVAQYLKVDAAAALAIGDSMQNGRWRLDFDLHRAEEGLKTLLDAAVAELRE
ncbi:MAG: nucleoside phosphorylase [Anaerolineae bacterium]